MSKSLTLRLEALALVVALSVGPSALLAEGLQPFQREILDGTSRPNPEERRQAAQGLVVEFATALNRGDLQAIAAVLPRVEETGRLEAAQWVLQDYQHHFSGEPVVRVEPVEDGHDPNHLYYELTSAGGAVKAISVYFDSSRGTLELYDEFIDYSPRVHTYVEAVIRAIQDHDSGRLARLLSVDDVDYPVELAGEVISAYRSRFDLETLLPEFSGLGPQPPSEWIGSCVQRPFLFTISGSQGGRAVHHMVELRHGDGLLSWNDPLVPPPDGDHQGWLSKSLNRS